MRDEERDERIKRKKRNEFLKEMVTQRRLGRALKSSERLRELVRQLNKNKEKTDGKNNTS